MSKSRTGRLAAVGFAAVLAGAVLSGCNLTSDSECDATGTTSVVQVFTKPGGGGGGGGGRGGSGGGSRGGGGAKPAKPAKPAGNGGGGAGNPAGNGQPAVKSSKKKHKGSDVDCD